MGRNIVLIQDFILGIADFIRIRGSKIGVELRRITWVHDRLTVIGEQVFKSGTNARTRICQEHVLRALHEFDIGIACRPAFDRRNGHRPAQIPIPPHRSTANRRAREKVGRRRAAFVLKRIGERLSIRNHLRILIGTNTFEEYPMVRINPQQSYVVFSCPKADVRHTEFRRHVFADSHSVTHDTYRGRKIGKRGADVIAKARKTRIGLALFAEISVLKAQNDLISFVRTVRGNKAAF